MHSYRMYFSFYSKDALPSPTFKCHYGNGISFWYFRCHHENSIHLINFLMFGKENKLKKTFHTLHLQDNHIKRRCRQHNRKAIRQHKCG